MIFEHIKLSERDEILIKYGFYFVEVRAGDRGIWKHVNKEYFGFLHLITKSEGNSCNFIELFNYDDNDPKDDFWHIWDNNSVLVSFDNKDELDSFLKILTRTR